MRRLVAALAVAAVGFAGCGGDDGGSSERLSKAEYEREVRALVKKSQEPPIDAGETPEGAAAAFAEARKRALRLASDLERLRPPAEVEQEQRDFVASLRSVAGDLERVIDLTRKGDTEALRRSADDPNGQLSPRTAELARRARAGWARKGYDLGLGEAPAAAP